MWAVTSAARVDNGLQPAPWARENWPLLVAPATKALRLLQSQKLEKAGMQKTARKIRAMAEVPRWQKWAWISSMSSKRPQRAEAMTRKEMNQWDVAMRRTAHIDQESAVDAICLLTADMGRPKKWSPRRVIAADKVKYGPNLALEERVSRDFRDFCILNGLGRAEAYAPSIGPMRNSGLAAGTIRNYVEIACRGDNKS